MRTIKPVLGTLVLLLGCLMILWPGIFAKPDFGEAVLATGSSEESAEAVLVDLLGQAEGSGSARGEASTRSTASADADERVSVPNPTLVEYEADSPVDPSEPADSEFSSET